MTNNLFFSLKRLFITWVVFQREKRQHFLGFFHAERRHHRQFVNCEYFQKIQLQKIRHFLKILKQAKSDSMNG